MITLTRFEVVRTLRDGRFLAFLIAFPVLLYVAFGRDDGAPRDGLTSPAAALVGLAAYAAIGAAMYAGGPRLALERANGWHRQLRVMPLPARAFLFAKIIQGLVLIVPGLVVLGVVAVVYGGLRMPAGHWAALAGVSVFGALPFVFVGLLVGLLLDGQAAHLGQVATLMAASFVGGLFIPSDQVPDGVRAVGRVLPTYHVAEWEHEVVAGRAVEAAHPAVIAAWLVGLAVVVLAVRRREAAA